jgi:hypothetical protein
MGAAIVGMILPSAFTILTGWIVSYVSLAVGWMVGTAIKKGSGGRRYQTPASVAPSADVRPKFPTRKAAHARAAESKTWPPGNASSRTSLANPNPTVFPPVRTHPRPLPVLRTLAAQPPGPSSRVALPQASSPQVPQAQTVRAKVQQLNSFAFARQLPWLTIGSALALFWPKGPTLGAVLNIAILSLGIIFAWRITAGVNLVIYGPFDSPLQPTR